MKLTWWKKILMTILKSVFSFYLNQAIVQKMREIGLGPLYFNNFNVRKSCRQILALNLMPAEKIEIEFLTIKNYAMGLLHTIC